MEACSHPLTLIAWRLRIFTNTVIFLDTIEEHQAEWGIFTAAVADYEPEEAYEGKWQAWIRKILKLVPTSKVIQEVKERFPIKPGPLQV